MGLLYFRWAFRSGPSPPFRSVKETSAGHLRPAGRGSEAERIDLATQSPKAEAGSSGQRECREREMGLPVAVESMMFST